MNKFIGYAALLIALFVVVYYYAGSTSVIASLSGGARGIIAQLMGADSSGKLPTSYPKS